MNGMISTNEATMVAHSVLPVAKQVFQGSFDTVDLLKNILLMAFIVSGSVAGVVYSVESVKKFNAKKKGLPEESVMISPWCPITFIVILGMLCGFVIPGTYPLWAVPIFGFFIATFAVLGWETAGKLIVQIFQVIGNGMAGVVDRFLQKK